jgi:L-threonylcarbamoyladenylate synthase
MERIVVDPEQPEAAAILRAATILIDGGAIAMPTDTLYGLAVDPSNSAAVAALFTIKDRAAEKAIPLVAADAAQVTEWFGALPPLARKLADRFWPGPLTLIVAASARIDPGVTGGGTTVGVRVPAHAATRALCRAAGGVLTATSANISGQPASADPDEVVRAIGARIAAIVDAGPAPGGPPSTIVDVAGGTPRLIREGAIPWDIIKPCVEA